MSLSADEEAYIRDSLPASANADVIMAELEAHRAIDDQRAAARKAGLVPVRILNGGRCGHCSQHTPVILRTDHNPNGWLTATVWQSYVDGLLDRSDIEQLAIRPKPEHNAWTGRRKPRRRP